MRITKQCACFLLLLRVGLCWRAYSRVHVSPGAHTNHHRAYHQQKHRRATVAMAKTPNSEPSRPPLSREVASVALPVLGACLIEPVLTLIDTFCVGHFGGIHGPTRLAALSTQCSIFNFLGGAFSFLCTATTNIVAKSSRGSDVDVTPAGKALVHGTLLACLVGGSLSIGLIVFRDFILQHLYGLTSDSDLLIPAARYMAIRALAVPAVFMNYVGVGICLGIGNTLVVLASLLLTAIANIAGDFLLVGCLKTGMCGAAIATVISAYCGAALVLQKLASLKSVGWPVKAPGVMPPSRSDIGAFATVSGALLAGQLCTGFTFSATARWVSGAFTSVAGSVSAIGASAAHQVALQVWWLLGFFTVPLSLAAQSIAPRELSADRPEQCVALGYLMLKLGLTLGSALAAINFVIPARVPSLLGVTENQPEVRLLLRSLVTTGCISQLANSAATGLDGVYIGCGKLKYYVFTCLTATFAAWSVALGTGGGLFNTWWALVVFAGVRLGMNLLRLPSLIQELKRST